MQRQAEEDELSLSDEALRALAEFASDRGLAASPSNPLFRRQLQDELDSKPRNEVFNFSWKCDEASDEKGNGSMTSNVKIKLVGLNRELGQTLSSTGLTVWRAGEELADFLWARRKLVVGLSIVELGAGLGLCGILAACLCGRGGRVSDSDSDSDSDNDNSAAGAIDAAAAAVGVVERLTWGQHDAFLARHADGFDLLLAADVVYEEAAVVPLVETAAALLRQRQRQRPGYGGGGAVMLLGFASRNVPVGKLLAAAEDAGLAWHGP
ncbi:unnamed protein product, partial [Phaeothamnion confervicola]